MADTFADTLGSRRWRLQHSVWMLSPILLMGAGAGVSFIYIGLKAKRRNWWIPGIAYTLVGAIGFALVVVPDDIDGTVADGGGGLLLAVWIAGAFHAALVNRAWLTWIARHEGRHWYEAPSPPAPHDISASATAPVASLGLTTLEYHHAPLRNPLRHDRADEASPHVVNPPPVPSQRPTATRETSVDVNKASADELSQLPGVTAEVANRAIDERITKGPFASTDEFALAAGLQPHVYARIRHTLTIPVYFIW